MSDITVTSRSEDAAKMVFSVEIDAHIYTVRLEKGYHLRLTGGKITPEELVKKSFEFLLEREGPEAILPEFDLPLIGRYFPEYEAIIRTRI